MTIFLSELLGTATFIFFGVSTNCANGLRSSTAKNSGWLFIALGWGIAFMLGGIVAAPSGSHLNPALTIALAINGSTSWDVIKEYLCGQLVGAITGACLAYVLYALQFHKNQEPAIDLFVTPPSDRFWPLNMLSEALATFFMIAILNLIAIQEFTRELYHIIAPLLIMGLGIACGSATGFALNPVKDLGPRIAHFLLPIPNKGPTKWSDALVPVLGSLIGAILAILLVRYYAIW